MVWARSGPQTWRKAENITPAGAAERTGVYSVWIGVGVGKPQLLQGLCSLWRWCRRSKTWSPWCGISRIQECGSGPREPARSPKETYSGSVSTWDKASLDVFLGRRCRSRPVQQEKKAKHYTQVEPVLPSMYLSALCWLDLPLPSLTEKERSIHYCRAGSETGNLDLRRNKLV